MKIDDLGPAFPNYHDSTGMTLRDWFAGQALADLAAVDTAGDGKVDAGAVAQLCYQLADAMIAQRGEGVKQCPHP